MLNNDICFGDVSTDIKRTSFDSNVAIINTLMCIFVVKVSNVYLYVVIGYKYQI